MEKLISYIKDAKKELDKVIFPTSREIKQGMISVFTIVFVVSLFLSLVDMIMSALLKVIL